jgi:hypothetical protein
MRTLPETMHPNTKGKQIFNSLSLRRCPRRRTREEASPRARQPASQQASNLRRKQLQIAGSSERETGMMPMRADGGRNQAISYVRRAMRLREVLISRALREVEETEEHEGTMMMQRRQGQRSSWTGCYVGDGSSPPSPSPRLASPLLATPQQLLLNSHSSPTRLYATPGWMLEDSTRFIHPHTSVAIRGVSGNKI